MPSEKATITLSNGTEQEIQGCTPALGYAFGGGTTDGPGEFPFNQGTESDSLFWNIIRNSIPTSTQEEKDCHAPKPILFNTGRANFPLPWQPRIVPTQILLFGQIALIAVPGEFTTMSGRRLRDAIQDTIIRNGGPENTKPVITGHSNDYTNYIATPEEYQLQRYEGASTIFGPQTLNLYIKKYKELAAAMVKGETLDAGPTPPDSSSPAMTVLPAGPDGVGQNFGECLQQPDESVSSGDTVVVKFVGGNPRHDTLRGGSYISVEKAKENDWVVVANDANWETRYLWKRMNVATGTSEVTIEWDVREGVEPGEYRIRHHGHHKTFTNQVKSYEGVSRNFTVT
ncbi:unnamed protein product [Tenebrio molitor]|nr:unnamed protein product [Tenebrio molitor]